jgi:hypothetical protein
VEERENELFEGETSDETPEDPRFHVFVKIEKNSPPMGFIDIWDVKYPYMSRDDFGLAEQTFMLKTYKSINDLMKSASLKQLDEARAKQYMLIKRIIPTLPEEVLKELGGGAKERIMADFFDLMELYRKEESNNRRRALGLKVKDDQTEEKVAQDWAKTVFGS